MNQSCDQCEDGCCASIDLLPAKADIFIYKDGKIQTNASRGFKHVPVVLHNDLIVHGQIHQKGADCHFNSEHVHAVSKQQKKHKDYFISSLEPHIHTDGQLHNATYYYVHPSHHIDILYVNPIKGPIVIVLGSEDNQCDFKQNQKLTIKDVSLNHTEGCSYNVYITTCKHKTNPLFIQHYNADCRLKVSSNGVYILNTSGGAVTFRYYKAVEGNHHAFNIEHQVLGNPRVLPGTGLHFNMAHEKNVQQLLRLQ
jgi:hypothetical protein